jgi:hypothetical protein
MTEYRTPLDEHMDRRRLDLRLTWAEVATRAEISRDTLHRIRSGYKLAHLRELTKRGIEDALEWEPGSFDDIVFRDKPPKNRARQQSSGRQYDDPDLQRIWDKLDGVPDHRRALIVDLYRTVRDAEEQDRRQATG